MINNKKSQIKYQLPFIFSLIFLSSYNFFYCQNSGSSKNKALPKEINLNLNTKRIIDSIFIFKNDSKKLETVQLFELKNGIVISSNKKYYVNDTLDQTIDQYYDFNGNNIESNISLHFENSNQKIQRKFDEHGNIIQLKTEKDNSISLIDYRNEYMRNKLVNVIAWSNNSGAIINKTSFKYDPYGNLIEESFKSLNLNAENSYSFNKSNQVIFFRQVRNGKLKDSIAYFYEKELLIKKEWYEAASKKPIVTIYNYNLKNQLILETDDRSGNRVEYKNYDSSDNWQAKYQYSSEKLSKIIKRTFIN